jgi:2-polyprenyl-3-methyl-5-hydroxy-6-metoxy-1,4-benzoquinol methylase
MNEPFSEYINHQCPICNSSISQLYYEVKNENDTYWVRKCLTCAHYYSAGDLDINTDELYNDDVYQVIDNRGSLFSKIIEFEVSHILKNISRLHPKGLRLLDFGSGKGNFLFVAKKLGYQVMGIETAIKRAEFAEEKFGLEIIKSLYTGGKIVDEGFDIITFFHVLEHLPNPKEHLSSLIKHNLKEGGMIIIEVPNLSSLQSRIAKNNWMHLDIPRHLSHFTKERMIRFADESDLRIIKIEYFSLHLGVIGMCQSILSLFGYKKKIIRDLKHYNVMLILTLIGILPFAFTLEIISSIFNRGGVIRLCCQYSPGK